ncbi:dynein assembly factor 3, axonemal-like [Chanos chanos]|uniref:Dynein assembly factor 3, axonemal-like n=1 Tax=Chanos chanos TaxID=29144 RepID=A0A6J2V2Y5_CHACN|nr:dynein assembly factor 3, axonemal-like [Chanos chanos]
MCVSLEKTEVFLEVFGNSEIRSQTEETLRHAASQLSASVTLDTHTHPCLDTSLLKFKERDELLRIFGQWLRPPPAPVSVSKAWEGRVRQHLGTRYDSRHGCFDWDLAMKLYHRGCGVINKQQYMRWRETGKAFELREGLYQTANQSLLSTRVFCQRGDKLAVRGYWGDIVSSPYLAFGIETDNKDLLKKHNNQHVKTAQDISVANVQALFESLSTRGRHPPPLQSASEGTDSVNASTNQLTESQSQPESLIGNITEQLDLMTLNGVKISFLSVDSLPKLPHKSTYSQLFNTIYFSASMVHLLDSSLKQTAAPHAVLVVELAKYLLDLSKEHEAGFAEKVRDIAGAAGFSPTHTHTSDTYATFTLSEHSRP